VAVRRVADPPRALLLDALGTLVELEPPAPALRELLAERLGVQVTEAQAERAIAAEIRHYRAHMGAGIDERSVAALQAECAEVLRQALPDRDALRALRRPALTGLLMDALRFRAFDDALPALAQVRDHGLRVVVASNWDASLPQVLARVGLLEAIDGVVCSAVAGAPKPFANVYRAALALAGAAPREAVHVGDSPELDVAGARALGIRAVLLRRDGDREAPRGVETIDSLAALPGLLGGSLS
jgi:putative hydrolase of the HAD superfamily